MAIVPIESLDDPRVAPYRNLKDADLRSREDRFIAEGKPVVLRLLASAYGVESILCSPRIVESVAPHVPTDVPLYVAADAEINRIIGYRFHNGCLAVGRATRIGSVEALLARVGDRPATLVVAHELNNTENLGAILRIAAGFGAAGLILGPRTADPFYRQSIRVSMGTVFSLPLAVSDDLPRDLNLLREGGFNAVATVAGGDAIPIAEVAARPRQAIVLGSEAHGLDGPTIAACTLSATIPMHLGTDSLNVAIACAVFLYQLTPQPGRRSDPAGPGRG